MENKPVMKITNELKTNEYPNEFVKLYSKFLDENFNGPKKEDHIEKLAGMTLNGETHSVTWRK